MEVGFSYRENVQINPNVILAGCWSNSCACSVAETKCFVCYGKKISQPSLQPCLSRRRLACVVLQLNPATTKVTGRAKNLV